MTIDEIIKTNYGNEIEDEKKIKYKDSYFKEIEHEEPLKTMSDPF